MRIEKIIIKYLMILCLSYTVVTLVFNVIALLNRATTLNIVFNLWTFAFCFIIVFVMAIFDKFHFDSIIVELILRGLAILIITFGGAVFAFGVIHTPIGIITLILVQIILFVIVYLLFYAKERRDAKEINDKLKRNN